MMTIPALLAALGLLIAAEGLIYAAFPTALRAALSALLALPEPKLRLYGFMAAGCGLLLVAGAGLLAG